MAVTFFLTARSELFLHTNCFLIFLELQLTSKIIYALASNVLLLNISQRSIIDMHNISQTNAEVTFPNQLLVKVCLNAITSFPDGLTVSSI